MSSNPSILFRFLPRRLSTALQLTFVALALFPAVLLTLFATNQESAEERQRVETVLSTYADSGAETIQAWVNGNREVVRDTVVDSANREILLTIVDPAADEAALEQAQEDFNRHILDLLNSTDFSYVLLADVDGVVRAASDPQLIGQQVNSEHWFREALDQPLEISTTGPLPDTTSGQDSIWFANAVRDEDSGTVLGVFMARATTAPIGDLLSRTLPQGILGQTGEYFVVREGQKYVITPRLAPNAELARDEVLDSAMMGANGSGTWLDYRGEDVIGAYRWIEPLQSALIVKEDTSEALSTVNERIRFNVLLGGLMAVVALAFGFMASRRIIAPLEALTEMAGRISRGDMNARAPQTNIQEIRQVATSLNQMTSQLQEMLEKQEDTIRARTRQLQMTAQIGRAIAAETDLERLLDVTISRIRDQLGHYHAQVFLLDDLRQYAVLRASTGEAGQKLLERGHKLPVGSKSVIGQVTQIGDPVLASDTLQAQFWMPNPLLPETRAELAVPIRVGDQILGALDVQSISPEAFDEETIAALQTIADQLAVALRNAQLFEEKEGLISASVQLTQMLTRENWDSFIDEHRAPQGQIGYRYDLSVVEPIGDGGNGHSEEPPVLTDQNPLSMPIALRGEVIGELEAILPKEQLGEEERQLVGQVLDRVALALENARLFEQTQLSLQESNRLYQASRRITEADSIDNLAQSLIELAVTDTVDRVVLLLLEDPGAPPEDRWARVSGVWTREPGDSIRSAFPTRLHTSQPPLNMIEQVESTGSVVNDVDTGALTHVARASHQAMGVKAVATFPLITSRYTIGWLVLHSTRQPNAFSEQSNRYYRTLADQAATALEGLRLLEQTQIRARRLQATNEVSRAASSILNPDILLPMVVERISEAFNYYHVQIFLIDEMGEWANLRASTGEVGQKLLHQSHQLEVGSQSVIGQVTATGEPFIVRDTDTDPIHRRNELLPETRSEMAIPLKTGDRVVGALDVQSTHINAFDPEAQQILQSLAGELAVTMENATLFQEIQDRVGELTTINLVSQAVSRANTLEEVYDVVATQLTRTFGVRYGFLAIYDAERQMINLPLFLENGQLRRDIPSQPLGTGLTSHVIRNRQMLLINQNLEQEAEKLGARIIGSVTKSLLAVPMQIGDEIIGVISIQDNDQENAFNEAHVRQLTTLSAYIAVKIRNAELLEEAQRTAGELGFLFNVTRAAVGSSDLDSSLTSVVEILSKEIKGTESAIIYLASPDGDKLEPHAAVGWARDMAARGAIDWGQGMVGWAATIAQSLVIDDAQSDDRFTSLDPRVRGAVLVPLMTATGLIGILAVESSQPRAFDEGALRLLETASGTLTAIIQNARLLEEVARANEELKELDRLKSQFLANMSHELRTPLNSIIGFSRVMLKGIDGPLNELQTQDLNTIYNSGQHLLGLINDILDLSKIEAKMMEIQPEYTSLHDIVDGVMSTAKGLTKDRPIELYRELPHELPQVWGDPQRLRQVLLNLISNAAKFTREGSVTVRASRLDYDPETGKPPRVQVDVIDTGIGIPEDKIAHVFEAFQQVDGTTTRQFEGTGLGLPISKNFIELHGGELWATSEVGKGSVFSFWVPLHPVTAEGAEVLYRASGDERPLVLAIDDEPGVIDLYTRYLEQEGYAVMGLGHANDIVRHVRELQPAAVILDLNLPGKDGWLAINDLKQNVETQHIPVLVCSIDEDRERANDAGVAEYLVKPFTESDLVGAMRRAMDGGPRVIYPVLVIDAYTDHAEYVKTSLESTGYYSVKTVSVGYEGLQSIQETPPAAVVIDIDLPDMDGYGLLVAMRSHPDTKHIPIVILTARELTPEDLAKLGPWDITGYLSKYDYDGLRVAEKLAEVMTKSPKPA